MMKIKLTAGLVVFTCCLLLPLSNIDTSVLGFADAAEFALVSRLGGVAHAPGFPAYTILSHAFLQLPDFLSGEYAQLFLFSTLCMALASLLLYSSALIILKHLQPELKPGLAVMAAALTALGPVSGATIWHWSHSVEVYSLQILFTGMVMYGLLLREDGYAIKGSIWAAIGFGLGLSNHHLTMIFLAPVILLLWPGGWLKKSDVKKGKLKNSAPQWAQALKSRDTLVFALLSAAMVLLCYGWLMIRSSSEVLFAFGSPDNLDRLIYHLSGGAWMNNTRSVVKGIVAMRLPYFLKLTMEQFFLLLPFVVLGCVVLIKAGRNRLWTGILFYFILIFLYQLRIDQTADTDAYLCTPFFLCSLLVAPGIAAAMTRQRMLIYILPPLVLIQIFVNFGKTDLRDFDLSTAILRDLDRSAPKGSVVLIADWTGSINALNERISRGFRKDLCVLNYDIKFTHFDLFRRNYPEIYKEIAPQYNLYIDRLSTYHPLEIYNTGCTLDQPDLLQAYLGVVRALQSYCEKRGVAFMADPKAFVFLSQQGVFNNAHVSGSYISTIPGSSAANDGFLALDHRWIDNRHALNDPSAADKLVDLEAALDMHRRYWQQTGDTARFRTANERYLGIKMRQREMKKKMQFLFRPS